MDLRFVRVRQRLYELILVFLIFWHIISQTRGNSTVVPFDLTIRLSKIRICRFMSNAQYVSDSLGKLDHELRPIIGKDRFWNTICKIPMFQQDVCDTWCCYLRNRDGSRQLYTCQLWQVCVDCCSSSLATVLKGPWLYRQEFQWVETFNIVVLHVSNSICLGTWSTFTDMCSSITLLKWPIKPSS